MGKEPIPGYTGLRGPWVTGEPGVAMVSLFPWLHPSLLFIIDSWVAVLPLPLLPLFPKVARFSWAPAHALNSYFTVSATSCDWTFVFYHMPHEVIFTVCCCTFKVCGVHSNRCFHDWKTDRPYVYCRYIKSSENWFIAVNARMLVLALGPSPRIFMNAFSDSAKTEDWFL